MKVMSCQWFRMRRCLLSSIFCLSGGVLTSFGANLVVSDNDLVMNYQGRGEMRRNLSFSGKALSIAGKTYAEGVGSHATSMFPITAPKGVAAGGYVFSGACGVDDGASGEGGVRFAVLSGSEVLWESPEMKKGMPAERFSISVPTGTGHLYLRASEGLNDDSDHADWVDLAWSQRGGSKANKIKSKKGVVLEAADFGLKAGVREDQSAALQKAISALRAHPGATLNIVKGEYHFYREGALGMSFHLSNHDQPKVHPVGVPLVDLNGAHIKGNGSLFLFHGQMMPVLIMDSKKVTLADVAIDFERPFYSEAVVVSTTPDTVDVTIDKKHFPFEVQNKKLKFIGEGWETGIVSAIAFEKKTGHIVEGTSDIGGNPDAEMLPDGKIRLSWNLEGMGIKAGDTLTLRNWARPHPAVGIYRAEDTVLNKVPLHSSFGMALLAQRSSNISIHGGGSYPRKDSGRVYSASADATHYSNTKGLLLSEGGTYEGMMDDAINVHSTCLSLAEIGSPDTIRCTYKHGQAVGFEVFLPGEKLRFIAGPTLENGAEVTVKSVRKLDTNNLLITLAKPLPKGVVVGDAVENADYQPEVIFRGNVVRNNRARGSLFTTPKRVLVEGNNFDHSSGSALLLAGDAQGWYESGPCYDVIIRKNKFTHNLTSRYQFTNAILSFYPEVKQLDKQKKYYHRNVLIEDNEFVTHDVPILFAISTDGIIFRNNNITYLDKYKSWGKKPFEFKRCANVTISGNKIMPKKTWTLQDCVLSLTPEEEVKITP